ncbi:hypothetical protein QR680_005304 [Steinernema hermaphroditum]|uniref:Uncharacterized protein n=1 Tax=Steinernema hermaphroditum TaxID=289476 RepID=A0AA39LVE4_9BILA|nr:hypothetical protein QR680_005304 [Steinernema hermaphroditum]
MSSLRTFKKTFDRLRPDESGNLPLDQVVPFFEAYTRKIGIGAFHPKMVKKEMLKHVLSKNYDDHFSLEGEYRPVASRATPLDGDHVLRELLGSGRRGELSTESSDTESEPERHHHRVHHRRHRPSFHHFTPSELEDEIAAIYELRKTSSSESDFDEEKRGRRHGHPSRRHHSGHLKHGMSGGEAEHRHGAPLNRTTVTGITDVTEESATEAMTTVTAASPATTTTAFPTATPNIVTEAAPCRTITDPTTPWRNTATTIVVEVTPKPRRITTTIPALEVFLATGTTVTATNPPAPRPNVVGATTAVDLKNLPARLQDSSKHTTTTTHPTTPTALLLGSALLADDIASPAPKMSSTDIAIMEAPTPTVTTIIITGITVTMSTIILTDTAMTIIMVTAAVSPSALLPPPEPSTKQKGSLAHTNSSEQEMLSYLDLRILFILSDVARHSDPFFCYMQKCH